MLARTNGSGAVWARSHKGVDSSQAAFIPRLPNSPRDRRSRLRGEEPHKGRADQGRRSANVISLDEASGGPGEESVEAQIASEDPTPEARLIGEVDRGLIRSAPVELPPIFREVIMLREIEGLAYPEISQVTGAPLGTVMSRLARGRRELHKASSRTMEKDKLHAV